MLNNEGVVQDNQPDEALQRFIDRYSPPKKEENITIPTEIKYDENYSTFFDGTATHPLAPEPTLKPGFLETVGHTVLNEGEITRAYTYLKQKHEDSLPLYDPHDPDWSPKSNEAMMVGIWHKNQGRILAASGPKDQERRYYDILDAQAQEEFYRNGSFAAHLVGGGLALTPPFSPSMLIFGGIAAKYGAVAPSFLEGFSELSSGIAVQSLVHNAWNQTLSQNGNMQDFIDGFYNDTIAGVALIGGGLGLSKAFTGWQAYRARGTLKLVQDGIDPTPVLNTDGEMTRVMARSTSAGAAEVKAAEEYLNSNMVKSGLFGIPIAGNMIGKGAAKFNPIFRMMNSEFPHVAGIIDRVADHGIVTERNAAGFASPVKFENILDTYQAETTNAFAQIKALYLERNGIDISNPVYNKVQEMKASYMDTGYVTPEKFQGEIDSALRTKESSSHAAVNDAVAIIRPLIDTPYKRWRELENLPEEILDPLTAEGYSMRVYNTNEMENRQIDWEDLVSESLAKQDAVIESLNKPINDYRDYIKSAERDHIELSKRGATNEEVAKSAENIALLKKELGIKKSDLQDELRNNRKHRAILEDAGALSAREAKELKQIFKPLETIRSQQKEAQVEISKLKNDKLKIKARISKAQQTKTVLKNIESTDAIDTKISAMEDKVDELYHAEQQAKDDLNTAVHEGKISKLYYTKKHNGEIIWKDPKDRLKTRKPFKDNNERLNAATAYYHTILNQSAEDTIAQTMDSLLGRHGENALKHRTLLIPDEDFTNSNFLSKDLMVNVANYRLMLARKIALIETFGKEGEFNSGFQSVVAAFRDDFIAKNDAINNKIRELEAIPEKTKEVTKQIESLQKELKRLQKSFKDNKEDVRLTYEKMMGRTRASKSAREYTRMARNFAVSTKLGAVPLTMITDFSAIGMKHNYWPTIRDGVIPALQNISNLMKKGAASDYEKTAKYSLVALTNNISATADRNWSGLAQPYTPLGGKLAKGIENMAHISNTMAGTIMLDNFFQRLTASTIDAKIVRYCQDFLEGKLNERDKMKLLVYGLQPETWAKRIVDGWASRDKDGDGGAAISRFFEWEDKEASNMMASTIRRGVKDTVIRRGMFDAPFAMDDPWIGTMFLFKGWLAASFTRFLLPLMQRPDAEKLLGTFIMLTAGALVTPLRRITKGEDPIQDGDKMAINAMIDSGVFSAPMDIFQTINALTAGTLMKDSQNDRYQNRSIAGYLMGPIGGTADDFAHIIRMMGTGNFNKQDLKKAIRQIPGTQPWYARGAWNKLIGSTSLPENFGEAQRQ